MPSERAASIWPFGHRLDAAPDGLGEVGAGHDGQADRRGAVVAEERQQLLDADPSAMGNTKPTRIRVSSAGMPRKNSMYAERRPPVRADRGRAASGPAASPSDGCRR